MWFNILGLVLLLQTVIFADVFDSCRNNYHIDSSRSIVVNSPYYPYKYDSGSACLYTFTCPDDYEIYIACDMNLDKGSTCTSEYFYMSQDADPDLKGASQFCGTGSVARVSEYSKLSFAFVSTAPRYSGAGGTFSCRLSVRPQACDCGWSQRGRIVGGSQARPTEFPSMVAIYVGGTVVCGGSILNHRTIVTANHCVRLYSDKNQISIKAGYYNVSSDTESRYARTYGVSEIIENLSYNPNGEFNDIALLITSSSIEYSRGVGPICLLIDTTSLFEYQEVIVVGYGTIKLGGAKSNIMKKAATGVIPNNRCISDYPRLQSSQVCTYRSGQDACQSDSGGPVIIIGSTRQYLFGIISYGRDCAGRYPGVNLRVIPFIDWIREKAKDKSFCFKPYQ